MSRNAPRKNGSPSDAVRHLADVPSSDSSSPSAQTPQRSVVRSGLLDSEPAGRDRGALVPTKERLSFRLPANLVEEIRGAIVQVGGPLRLTLDGLATRALRDAVDRLRTEFNDGEPFARRPRGSLRPGRPVGS